MTPPTVASCLRKAQGHIKDVLPSRYGRCYYTSRECRVRRNWDRGRGQLTRHFLPCFL